ncbi:Actin-related protein 2/3 complex subunit [Populus alba x Populus x berolinensis]|uniref:Actin-related protein 2/3 complex subunit n=1 Tax=Populus alba x Populus x berolinensis TaxID=444605 RepID=A0AAD6PS84_9ROSI|nr:Actin-related protein 2/3 complex subunit [Populus alba x Populus x berolinensis]
MKCTASSSSIILCPQGSLNSKNRVVNCSKLVSKGCFSFGIFFWEELIRGLVHHSSFVDEEGVRKACGCPLLPLKSHIKGPAPVSDQDRTDIVDEAITFFRANVFFRNFDIQSPADKLLIYLTFYINVALKRLEGCRTLAEGTKAIINLGLEKVPVPGESGFPFPGLFADPQSQKEAELFRNYLKQIREETSGRLLSVAYRPNGTPNKWWLAFAKRKFMNREAIMLSAVEFLMNFTSNIRNLRTISRHFDTSLELRYFKTNFFRFLYDHVRSQPIIPCTSDMPLSLVSVQFRHITFSTGGASNKKT